MTWTEINKTKNLNKNFVGIHSNTSSWKFQNIQTKTVPTARSSSFKPVPECTSDFELTRRPDLLTWKVKIYTQGVFLICAEERHIWRRAAPPFLRYLRKTGGGHNMPPSSARVNPRPGRAFSITCPGRGGGEGDPPGVSKLSVVALREKHQTIALDEYSRLVVYFWP